MHRRDYGRLRLAVLLVTGWLALFFSGRAGAVTVTVTQRAPLESLSSTGEISGVTEASVGAHFTFVSATGNQLVLRDVQGNQFRIAESATDYMATAAPALASKTTAAITSPSSPTLTTNTASAHPPVSNAPSATSTNAPASVPVAAITNSPAAVPASTDSSASALDASTMNSVLGKPVFSGQPLWQETALLVAQRMKLGLEGRTKWEASYRRYFSGQPDDPVAAFLGTGAYCVALYADADDHPTSLLIAFANDGDYRGIGKMASDFYALERPLPGAAEDDANRQRQMQNALSEMEVSFEPVRKAQETTLMDRLTHLLGSPQEMTFGSDQATMEKTERWDWNGASFLLTCQRNKYNLLRIVPTELADSNGHTARISRDDIAHRLSDAVERRDSGDVIITQIPMADQGGKGYCVPATWERVLRYTGVPGDMYTLSRIGDANFGGGEAGEKISKQLNDTLYHYGRHVEVLHPTHLDYIAVRHYIDDGIPIFWGVNPEGYEAAKQRYSLCDRNKDFDSWQKLLDQARANPETGPLKYVGGHQVLIIGYNPNTKELAWSDPWGKSTEERWMTQEEAQRCSLNDFYIISW